MAVAPARAGKRLRRAFGIVGALAALGIAGAVFLLRDRSDLGAYTDRRLPALGGEARGAGEGALRMTFLGVSTVLFDDGETAILTDGFFTRPGLVRTLVGRIEPDRETIERSLRRAGIERLAAVVVVHSHYDHAMDAPEVARRTGALLVGSASTANVGRGWGLPDARIRIVRGGETLELGRFRVTLVRSRHFPHGMAMGKIEAPLRPPARATAYQEGGSFSVLLEHEGRTVLVQGSAGFEEDALRGRRAEVVLLGVGMLGSESDAYREAYWREVVGAVGARRVIAIHWDDFFRPLDEPLRALPRSFDDLDASMRFLLERAEREGVDVRLANAWRPVDPFADLP